MKKQHNLLYLLSGLVMLILVLSACAPGSPTEEVGVSTVASSAGEVDSETGTITGELSYPSEYIPSQRVIAFNITDPTIYYYVEIAEGGTYSLEVPTGTYVVLSYLIDPVSAGATPGVWAAYSKVVPCGLSVDCTDHGLQPVPVDAGEVLTGINPGDWYLEPGVDAGWPKDPMNNDDGSISGSLGYPSEMIPPQRVVAFDVFSDEFFYTDTALNQSEYLISGIPAGTYHVVAYLLDEEPHMGAGYSNFVTCGLSADCDDHSLIDVLVYPGLETYNINPVDWYALPTDARWPGFPNP